MARCAAFTSHLTCRAMLLVLVVPPRTAPRLLLLARLDTYIAQGNSEAPNRWLHSHRDYNETDHTTSDPCTQSRHECIHRRRQGMVVGARREEDWSAADEQPS